MCWGTRQLHGDTRCEAQAERRHLPPWGCCRWMRSPCFVVHLAGASGGGGGPAGASVLLLVPMGDDVAQGLLVDVPRHRRHHEQLLRLRGDTYPVGWDGSPWGPRGQGPWVTHGDLGSRISGSGITGDTWQSWGQGPCGARGDLRDGVWDHGDGAGHTGTLEDTQGFGDGSCVPLPVGRRSRVSCAPALPEGPVAPLCAGMHEGTGWAGDRDSEGDSQGSHLTSSRENLSTWVRRSCLNLQEEGPAGGRLLSPSRGTQDPAGCPEGPCHPPLTRPCSCAGGVQELEGVEDGLPGVGALAGGGIRWGLGLTPGVSRGVVGCQGVLRGRSPFSCSPKGVKKMGKLMRPNTPGSPQHPEISLHPGVPPCPRVAPDPLGWSRPMWWPQIAKGVPGPPSWPRPWRAPTPPG